MRERVLMSRSRSERPSQAVRSRVRSPFEFPGDRRRKTVSRSTGACEGARCGGGCAIDDRLPSFSRSRGGVRSRTESCSLLPCSRCLAAPSARLTHLLSCDGASPTNDPFQNDRLNHSSTTTAITITITITITTTTTTTTAINHNRNHNHSHNHNHNHSCNHNRNPSRSRHQ